MNQPWSMTKRQTPGHTAYSRVSRWFSWTQKETKKQMKRTVSSQLRKMLAESPWMDVSCYGEEAGFRLSQYTKKVGMKDPEIQSPSPFSGPGASLRSSFAHNLPGVWLGVLPIPVLRWLIWLGYLSLPIKSPHSLSFSSKKYFLSTPLLIDMVLMPNKVICKDIVFVFSGLHSKSCKFGTLPLELLSSINP